jgi:ABC-type multidrug transport system fused ATPase/permease subunit
MASDTHGKYQISKCVVLSLTFPSALPTGQSQGQAPQQTIAPVPASTKSLSNQSTVTAEQRTDAIERLSSVDNASTRSAKDDITVTVDADPLDLGKHRREGLSQQQMKQDFPLAKPKHMKKFYTRQNALIDQFLQSGDEERLAALDHLENGPKVRFAVNASFVVNFCLFIIQIYAAVSTGSLSLFATAADAFMDLVSSVVMLVTSRMAARPSVYKYPVGRTRIETIGIIMFCCLMTTVAIQLIVSIPYLPTHNCR